MQTTYENRSAERFSLTYEVEFENGTGFTRNISKTGVYFETSSFHNVGSIVQFSIQLHKLNKEINRLRCHGRVIRTDQNAHQWGIAVNYLTLGFEYTDV
jgi:hypothetical protein